MRCHQWVILDHRTISQETFGGLEENTLIDYQG